ncbi:MAG: F0F1 ATP synthase subunit alpha, partial [Deltaproteobacteria bacterium]
ETRARLERGRRLREALKQPRLKPLRLAHEAAVFFAVGSGCLDAIPVEKVGDFLDRLCRRLDEVDVDLLAALERDEPLSESVAGGLKQACAAVERDLPKELRA